MSRFEISNKKKIRFCETAKVDDPLNANSWSRFGRLSANSVYLQLNILSKKYREFIIQKAHLKRLSKTFLLLSWHHCPLCWRRVRARSVIVLFTVLDVVSFSQVCFAIFPIDKNIEQRIHHKFCIANGKEYYLNVMKRLREQIRRKGADLWKENSWILHHDIAPSHKAIIVNKYLTKNFEASVFSR